MSNYREMPVHLLSDFFEKDIPSQINSYHLCLNPFTDEWGEVSHGLGLCRRHSIIYGHIMYQRGYDHSFWFKYPTLYYLVRGVANDDLLDLIDEGFRSNPHDYKGVYWFTDGWRRVEFAMQLKRRLESMYVQSSD
jgi:hypothetical protein